ncbi:hypothetical protein K502DRAFT_362299 [Neoconidiobolus thromboides FSU 785]|nr:hypothetical protein K502DRAFT_362299 [Neoconidiobolus thromboides FSU 785]
MTTLKLDNLPDIVADTIFDFLSPDVLYDLRFLNKALFKQINQLIFSHLCYSIYLDLPYYPCIEYPLCKKHSRYSYIQFSFYKKYRNNIQYLRLTSFQLKYLSLCPNIVILNIDYTKLTNIDTLDKLIPHKLPYIKNIILATEYNYKSILLKHINLLHQAKKVTVTIKGLLELDFLVSLLDPEKLTTLEIKCNAVNLTALGKLKVLFVQLKKLIVISSRFSIHSNFNDTSNFHSLEILRVTGIPVKKVPLRYLGDISKIKHVFIDIDDFIYQDTIKSTHPTIQSFGFTSSMSNIKSLFNVLCLREICISGTIAFESTFRAILCLRNLQVLTIHDLNLINHKFNSYYYIADDKKDLKVKDLRALFENIQNFIHSNSIRKVTFNQCYIPSNTLSIILFFLNGIRVVKFLDGKWNPGENVLFSVYYKKEPFIIQIDRKSINNSSSKYNTLLSYFSHVNIILDILE